MSGMNRKVPRVDKQFVLDNMQPLVDVIDEALHQGTALHEVELSLFRKLMEVGHELIAQLLELHGDGDCGGKVELADGRQVKRLSEPHVRQYLSIFGEFEFADGVLLRLPSDGVVGKVYKTFAA